MPRQLDHALKLIRAHEHLDDLYADVQWWRQSEPYRLIRERNPESHARVIYVEPTSQPPDKLALIAGDVVHNLRSCLDMLALALAEANCGGQLPEKEEGNSQFPICDERDRFRSARTWRIPSVAPRAQAVVQRCQPFRAREMRHSHPLWLLRELSDFDKHRRLPLVAAFASVTSVGVESSDHSLLHETDLSLGSVLQGKTEIARITPIGEGADRHEVDMNVAFSLNVVFGEGAPASVVDWPLFETVDAIWRYVAQEVIGCLKPYLDEPPAPREGHIVWPEGFRPKTIVIRKRGPGLL